MITTTDSILGTSNAQFAHFTLGTLPKSLHSWLRRTATPHGDVVTALDLFDTDRIGADLHVIVAYLDSRIAGWGLLRGYLSVFVEPVYRRRHLGSAIVEQFVRVHGKGLLFRTSDPGARAMFERCLTPGE